MIVLVDLISETEPNFKRANPEIAMFSLRCLLWEEKNIYTISVRKYWYELFIEIKFIELILN